MQSEKLVIKIKKGSSITEKEMNEMYAVRAHFMHLKPGIEKEVDFSSFKETIETAGKVFLFTTKTGTIKGSYTVAQFVEKCNVTGKKRLIIEPRFGFVLEEYQGKYMSKTVQRNAIQAFIKYPFVNKYLLGTAYPASYLTLEKYGKNVWTWLDNNVPADIKDVLYTYAQRHHMVEDGKFNGIKSLYTIPKKTGEEDIARLEKKKAYSHYKTLNPNWQEGYGLVTLTKISFSTLLHQVKMKLTGK